MNQIVLPTNIVKKVGRLSKELESIKKEIKRAVKVPRSQVWFWSRRWQKKEKEADRDIREGRVKSFSSPEELLKDLRE